MRLFVPVLALLTLAACASSTKPAPKSAPPPETTAAAVASTPTAASKQSLSRAAVRATVKKGLGAFLQRVTLADEPVVRDGAFVGFRLQAIDPTLRAPYVDLLPGDVVTKVNGFGLEHPEDALTAFKSLEVASELAVRFERDGKVREVRIPIAE